MREIKSAQITEVIRRLCIEANCYLPQDIKNCITESRKAEPWGTAQEILDRIIENYEIADSVPQPICQDTGVACVFLEMVRMFTLTATLPMPSMRVSVRVIPKAICVSQWCVTPLTA